MENSHSPLLADRSSTGHELVDQIQELILQSGDIFIRLDWKLLHLISKADISYPGESCSICLEDFEELELLVKHDVCSHSWHAQCAITAFRQNFKCPMCRGVIKQNDWDSRMNMFATNVQRRGLLDDFSMFSGELANPFAPPERAHMWRIERLTRSQEYLRFDQ